MKRILVIVVTVAVVLAVVAGVVLLATSDGPTAATFGNTKLSQGDIDDELRAIGENDTLHQAVAAAGQPPLSDHDGTVTANIGSGWLGLVISLELAAQTVERRGLTATAEDRDHATDLATQALGGEKVYRSFPKWFRDRVVGRFVPVAVLEREIAADPPPEIAQQLAAQCPSGRYVSHILLESEAEARTVKQQLDAGADFETLARRMSSDTQSARQGGSLGCADGQSFVEPFATVAATQPVGVVSDPITTQFGSHLVLVSDHPPTALLEGLAIREILGGGRGKVVHIDPRYGTWDRANGAVVPAGGAAQPSATP